MPALSILWLSDPDYSQHDTAPGSPTVLAALKSCDDDLAMMLSALEAKGARETTDVFVVSDHGFSTIERSVDVAAVLAAAGFDAVREFKEEPKPGQVLVVSLGGTSSFYVIGHDREVTRRLVEFLQRSDFAGVIFARERMPGTFTLKDIHIATPSAPDVMMAFRWSENKNQFGVVGSIGADIGRTVTHGSHGTLSRFDIHNTLIAAGPDFQSGTTDDLPSSNADVAPTILSALGIEPSQPMDGRVLFEAMRWPTVSSSKPVTTTLEADAALGDAKWHQHLRCTKVGKAVYFDEGNGANE